MRSFPSGKWVESRARVEGARMAAPIPCKARAAMSQAADCARPISSEVAVNSPSPSMNMRRRPNMSPALAPSNSKPPKARV
ncbi:hypothetical protein D3C80_1737580 [compost metagenome]